MNDIDMLTAPIRDGFVPAYIYNDENVFRLEVDRLFSRAWVFLAHESEIPQANDFVVRRVVDDSFLVTRDRDGEVHAMFNMCVHRGMQVCRAERGAAVTFRCPYHAWTYLNDGTLAGLPFHDEAYGGDDGFVKDGQALLPAPSMCIRHGMIFVSLDPDAPPFDEWLGDFAYYLDFYMGQSAAGMEFRGPQRWRVNANWKIGAENFCGDSYHTPHTHASVVEIGLFGEPRPHKRKEGVLYQAGAGSGTTYKLPAGGDFESGMRHAGYHPDVISSAGEMWGVDGLQALIGGSGFMPSAATIFPNLSFVHNWPEVVEGRVAPFVSVRQWQPVGPGETEVFSWFAVAADAPDEFKDDSYRAYLMCFGSSGMFEQDDVENWVSITTTARGTMARRLLLNSRMGLRHDGSAIVDQFADFAGPGVARQGFGEHNQRHLLSMWADAIEREPPRDSPRFLRHAELAVHLLPYTSADHQLAHQFLVEEAHLLDTHQFEAWFDLLTDDITYTMPVRVTALKAVDETSVQTMHHFAENRYSLRKRVDRFLTRYAWTEDPQSRVRHHVSNIRTFAIDDADALVVESALLLFRSRGDRNEPDLLSAGRTDHLRKTTRGLRLASRVIQADEAVLRTQNLAVFL